MARGRPTRGHVAAEGTAQEDAPVADHAPGPVLIANGRVRLCV